MSPGHLTAEQEAVARRLQEESRADLLALARLLVSKPESEIFGQTEFQARDVVHRIAAKAFTAHLGEKTAIAAPASAAPIVSKPQTSKTTGRRHR